MRFVSILLLLTALSVQAQPTVGPEPEVPIRIMPLGDSITEGNDGGFRIPLIRMITQAFEMPDMVGRRTSRQSDHGVGHDHDQDGYSAYRIDEIASGEGFWDAPPIEQRLDDWDPAVVLLHAGTNDAQQNYHPYGDASQAIPNVVERLDDLVSRIVAHAPHVYVILAQIIPANPPASQRTSDYIVALNQRIPGIVARHQALGHHVSLVDMHTPMLAFPNPDGIHPSIDGFQKMAEVWFEGLRAIGFLDGQIHNPEPGRDDGVRLREYYSTSSETPWLPSEESLICAESDTFERAVHTGYDGTVSTDALHDGLDNDFVYDPDFTWTSTFVLDTQTHTAGYDLAEIRSGAGAATNAKATRQAYELWYSTVSAPTEFVRLGDFHHNTVNDLEKGSALVIDQPGGVLASGVKAIQFRFVEPPIKQRGFFGVATRARYYEVEAFGVPTATRRARASSTAALSPFALGVAYPNPFTSFTQISVGVPETSHVRVAVYDMLGRTVATLVDGILDAGQYTTRFDASELPSGTYLMRMEAEGTTGSFVETQRVTRLR